MLENSLEQAKWRIDDISKIIVSRSSMNFICRELFTVLMFRCHMTNELIFFGAPFGVVSASTSRGCFKCLDECIMNNVILHLLCKTYLNSFKSTFEVLNWDFFYFEGSSCNKVFLSLALSWWSFGSLVRSTFSVSWRVRRWHKMQVECIKLKDAYWESKSVSRDKWCVRFWCRRPWKWWYTCDYRRDSINREKRPYTNTKKYSSKTNGKQLGTSFPSSCCMMHAATRVDREPWQLRTISLELDFDKT